MYSFRVLDSDLFLCIGIVIHTTDAEAEAAATSGGGDQNEVETLISQLPASNDLKELKLVPLDFEKVFYTHMNVASCK